jgi:peptidoglycan/LPS O-acetylase OafA/YrhL
VFLAVAIKGAPFVTWGTTFGVTLIALCAAVLVYAAIDLHPVAPLRFLTWRPVTYVGEISYALYIWHWPVIYLWPGNLLPVSARVAVSVALASASYHLVEKPFLRRKPAHTPDTTQRDAALGPIVVRSDPEAG